MVWLTGIKERKRMVSRQKKIAASARGILFESKFADRDWFVESHPLRFHLVIVLLLASSPTSRRKDPPTSKRS